MIFGVFDSWAQVLEVSGVWLAALATLLASYVALNIANRANRQSIKVTARPMLEVSMGGGLPKPIFHVSATNLGRRPTTIVQLGARSAFGSSSFILTTGMPGSSPVPTTLNDGETAHWRFPEDRPDGESWYNDFASYFTTQHWTRRWISLATFRFLIVTSLGKTFSSKPSSEFRRKILAQTGKGSKQ